MKLKRPNTHPCFFCGKTKSVAATYGAENKILCICRSCSSEVLPELIAEASFLDIQNEVLMPDTKDQNRQMPREYALKWDLLGLKYTQKLLELSHGYDECVITPEGTLVTEEHLEKMESLSKKS